MAKTLHGHSPMKRANGRRLISPTYSSWMSMKGRCKGTMGNLSKKYYAGVPIYEPWLDFCNFLQDMGERPAGAIANEEMNPEPPSIIGFMFRSRDDIGV